MEFRYPRALMLQRQAFNESNDCVVRAIAIAYGMTYPMAHDACMAAGRKHRDGIRTSLVVRMLQHANHIGTRGLKEIECRGTKRIRGYNQLYPTLKDLEPLLRKGRFILRKRDHAFAVVDGVQYDWVRQGPQSRITDIWEITIG